MEPKGLKGILPAIVTPFNRDGDVEFEYLREVVRFQLEKGVHGFFACGSAGEGPLMSIEQRKAVAETTVKEVAGRVPVIVHVGATNTNEAIELARHAEAVGATAVGVVTPYYFTPDIEGLTEHYRLIAEGLAIPVLAYNNPSRTGFNIAPEIARRLCGIPNVIGVKDSSGNLAQIREIMETAPKPITVINGSDNLLLAALVMGVDGQISGTANVIPELFVELYEAHRKGDYEKALNLQAKINAVIRVLDKPLIAPIKAALEMRGVKAGLPKRPLRPFAGEELSRLKERLRNLNLFW